MEQNSNTILEGAGGKHSVRLQPLRRLVPAHRSFPRTHD